MRVGIATDHGGFSLKEELLAYLREAGHKVIDVGAHVLSPGDDYPDFIIPLAEAVASGKVERGLAGTVVLRNVLGSREAALLAARPVRFHVPPGKLIPELLVAHSPGTVRRSPREGARAD